MSFLGFGKSSTETNSEGAGVSGSSGSSGNGSGISGSQQAIVDQIKGEIGTEIATEYAKSLMNAINDNCFQLCVPQPGATLSPTESKCVDDCTAKFVKAWSVVSQSYMARIKK